MKIRIFLSLSLLVISLTCFAQEYKTGLGLRAGLGYGFTAKHFISQKDALEGLFVTRWNGINFTGLYEIHNTAFNVDHLYWYFGGGAHIGFWNGTHTPWGSRIGSYTVIGIDGIIGIEYNFQEVPINISADWKPAFNFVGYSGFWGGEGALSVRYIF